MGAIKKFKIVNLGDIKFKSERFSKVYIHQLWKNLPEKSYLTFNTIYETFPDVTHDNIWIFPQCLSKHAENILNETKCIGKSWKENIYLKYMGWFVSKNWTQNYWQSNGLYLQAVSNTKKYFLANLLCAVQQSILSLNIIKDKVGNTESKYKSIPLHSVHDIWMCKIS